jgi:hypothetical protein
MNVGNNLIYFCFAQGMVLGNGWFIYAKVQTDSSRVPQKPCMHNSFVVHLSVILSDSWIFFQTNFREKADNENPACT